jgi:glycosyltransferase involved in cell wall biosynthesis
MSGVLRPLLVGAESFPEHPGGLNRYVHDLVEALSESGAEPRLVVADDPSSPLPARLWSVRRRVREQAPGSSLVDAHFALYAALPLLTGAFGGRAFMAHFHGPWADEAAAVGERSRLKLAAKRALEGAVYRRAERTVVLSSAFKRLLVERYGVSPWSVEVVPPAVDLERFTPGDARTAREALGLPEAGPVAVCIRRIVPRMGIDVLLRAWSGLESGLLVVVGEGPERARLERLADELGLGPRVRFAGKVADAELPDWYRAADVCVIPSLELEGFGLVALEALATGTPIVVSDAGGLPEAVRGLGDGLVVPRGDETALGTRLREALSGASPLPAPARCRAHAEGYSKQAFARRHREIYDRLRDRRPATRRRVVYVDHVGRVSGAELALLHIIEALDGVDGHVILGEDGPLVERLQAAGVSVEVLPLAEEAREVRRERVRLVSLGVRGPASAALYVPRLARRLHRLRPDIVHTNSLKSGFYGSLAARLCGIPAVWHLHDRLAPDYLPGQAAGLARRAIKVLPSALVVNSEATLATVASVRGGTVVPNPINVPPSPLPVRERVERVGVVGRLTPWKGQHVFLEAFSRAFAGTGVTAVLVGAPMFGEEEEYEARLRRQAEELGIQGQVEFRGFRSDVPAELARLDVAVHSSVVAEPFGQVILEAMAAGVPVVATSAGGAAEIVNHEANGLLYPPGDAHALAAALTRLAGDEALRRRLAGAGRERAADYSPEAAAQALQAVYAELLDRR